MLPIAAYVRNEAECQMTVDEAAATFGRLDILVNNAGTSQANPFESVGSDLWQDDLDLKLFGAINCSKAAIPHMRKAVVGAIVNLSAVKG